MASAGTPLEPPAPRLGPIDTRRLAERSKRIAVLREFLHGDPPPPDDLTGPLLDELAGLLESIGELDEALRIREQEQLPVFERLGDVRSKAGTLFKIARVELDREQYDAAMGRLRETYEIFERLGTPDGLAAVGEVYGPLLCREGERKRGLAVPETAREAAACLGQDSRARSGKTPAEPPRPDPPGFWSRLWRRLAGKP